MKTPAAIMYNILGEEEVMLFLVVDLYFPLVTMVYIFVANLSNDRKASRIGIIRTLCSYG